MPSYVFKCKNCAYVFETILKVSEVADEKCTKCGSADIEQVFSRYTPYLPKKSSCGSGTGFT